MKTIEDLYKGIGMTSEIRDTVDSVVLDHSDYQMFKKLFEEDIELFYTEVKKRPGYRQLFLYLYLNFAYDLYPTYKQGGINDTIYFDTFHDIITWTFNCKRDYGEVGLDEYGWIKMHLKLRLFKLGRLQYEVVNGGDDVVLNRRPIKDNEMALNLHIPQGEPLNIKKCRESLRQARGFFGQYKEVTCQSWLLAPSLQEILPKESNIVHFQQLFQIYDLDMDSREAEERVYNKLEDNPEMYDETTSLQKVIKGYLLEGYKIGKGFGIIAKHHCIH